MDFQVENGALLEINRMELRSGRNLVKCAADSKEIDGISNTSTENTQDPRRKSIHIKRSVGEEKENEEPAIPCMSTENSPYRMSSQRKMNNRKSKLEEENEEMSGTSSLVENAQTPNSKLSQSKKRRKSMQIVNEQPEAATGPLVESAQTPNSELSQSKKRRKSMQIVNEQPAETSRLVENAQTPSSKLGQSNKKRKSMQIVNVQSDISNISTENTQNSRRKSIHIKRSVVDEKENEEPAIPCMSIENSPDRKSSQRKMNKRKSKREEENEETSETSPLVENAQTPSSGLNHSKERRKSMQILNEQPEFIDLALPSKDCDVSSKHMIENVVRNNDLSGPISDQNEEDVTEILNSTFEVAEEDSILQTPARKRSVRFATSVETRRQTASFSSSADNTPKFSTPVSMNSKQRTSQYRGTPHPSAKKHPASILKTSSIKKFPSSTKNTSFKGKGSSRKMPDFNSIHKAQFEKMESIVDFSRRRHKCARKLETQAVDDSSKEVQLKPFAVIKPVEQTQGKVLSQIPVPPQNTSRHGTPRALSGSHIPVASFRVSKESHFDARCSAPRTIYSRPSSAKMGSNSRPKLMNNTKPQRITYEQAKATIQNKKPLAAVKRETERLENRNILKGVRLNRRFELQMQHRKLNM